ncbi:reactive intermediate/imine deaminase [Candidatus Peregrinibacteria bacterium CG22_combo_CG10-13_8_21_14_all_44_10]|nr:MAG: hypothetical protein AUK45_01305 [Candidatus Peregrinibacteria bacterium CG2_30_44_17]PIP66745.1 MAG: reactive intermediate/imine deaminase [Candidatus Peregrinibacteria bacterium CG22_combo_CG10-13_8_21_14_all_44_10]PIS03952.1 MAG: reactive intermediate/imine deaminase [Candidatus Peregrinibacteria bacterium CG10_big_fil_rev_8_21_14_0_10_44_7]PIX80411.1 MAG: reactive intermediate/imine deaminase [Candidatus Peregrinibacteria bacterium CG_4_10_14_3_um_filter_44_21]PJB89665.1 MAG: reacti
MKEIVKTDAAPQAVGPYSQAVKANGFVFCSGQIPYTPAGELVSEDVSEQARQCMNNVKAVLEAAGSGLGQIVKTTIFLKDMGDFKTVNEVYASFFEADYPARATVQVARLPLDVKVEIDAVASVD